MELEGKEYLFAGDHKLNLRDRTMIQGDQKIWNLRRLEKQ